LRDQLAIFSALKMFACIINCKIAVIQNEQLDTNLTMTTSQ